MNTIDIALFEALNAIPTQGDSFANTIFLALASYLPYGVIALALGVSALLLWRLKNMAALEMFFFVFSTSVIARFIFAELIREAYSRPRPFEVLDNVNLLISHMPGDSFPSGHAVFFFALASAFWLYDKRLGLGFSLLALAISVSRVVAGVHWPSDIVIGALLGVVVPVLTYFIAKFGSFTRKNTESIV